MLADIFPVLGLEEMRCTDFIVTFLTNETRPMVLFPFESD